jgi:hypothetical protein
VFDRLTKTIGDLLNSYVGLCTTTLVNHVKRLLNLNVNNIPFVHKERSTSIVDTVSLIINLDEQMLFEEQDYDKKLTDESANPFSELRLPVYDMIKYIIFSQCEICECNNSYDEQIIKRLYKNVIAAFNKHLPAVESMPRAMGLQLLFEFEFLVNVFQSVITSEQDTAIYKCKKHIWMLINGSREEVDNEGEVLTKNEMEEKAKQLKVIRYKSCITLESL